MYMHPIGKRDGAKQERRVGQSGRAGEAVI
jgi:hypothetical protein